MLKVLPTAAIAGCGFFYKVNRFGEGGDEPLHQQGFSFKVLEFVKTEL